MEVEVVLLLAAAARPTVVGGTIGILQERGRRDAHIVTLQLDRALESRIVIEQAKGIVAERAHVSVDAPFTLLRGFARSHNRRLSQTAHEIINGTLAPRR